MPPPTGYLSAGAIVSVVQHIATNYPSIATHITLPEQSVEGRTIHAVKIAKGGGVRRGVLVIGGAHAREIVNPDLILSLALKICEAYTKGTGLSFGPKTYTNTEVRLIVESLDLILLPLVNPDGRVHVQSPAGYAMWRKNRSLNPGQPCRGVDLNRNYDFLWSSGIGTSASSCSDVFKGPAAFSEPETRNVRHLLDSHPNIGFFIDVHSYSELLLYPWGDDDNQTTDPSQNFANPAFDGQRGVVGTGYREYIPAADLDWYVATSGRMRDAIAAVRGRTYTAEQAIGLYPTSGTGDDYAYSRHFVDTGKRKVFGMTIETAREFQPVPEEGQQVISEASAGLVELFLAATCAVETTARLTSREHVLDDLRKVREDELRQSRTGRRLVELVEGHSAELSALLAKDEALLADAGAALERLAALAAAPESEQVDTRLVDTLDDLGARLAVDAGPPLRQDIAAVRRDLPAFAGRTIRDILGEDQRLELADAAAAYDTVRG